MDSKVSSFNEWDTLKKVVVGVADYAQIPKLDPSLRTVNYANILDENEIPCGPYPKQVIDEANEDLDNLSNFLTLFCDVEVVRPKREPVNYYNYCPRDTVTVLGNSSVAAPMSLQSRNKEFLSYSDHLSNIIEIPNYQGDDIYNYDCIGNSDVLALKEIHPKFDAANIIRANDDLLYLVSNSGNKKGAEYLTSLGYNVHLLEGVYSYMHIDSTVAFLREGLMLLNPSRIKDINVLPKPFRNWDYIMCPAPTDIGHYPGYCNASIWINMNLLSVNPNLVVLEENQHSLRKELEKYGIDCAMLPMRHQRTLGGGFHCVTLDLIRE
jgi:N-dimethylarginine dimethylaminohydrolase